METMSISETERHYLIPDFVDVLLKRRGVLKSYRTLYRWVTKGARLQDGGLLKLQCIWVGGVRHLTLDLWDEFYKAQQSVSAGSPSSKL